MEDEFNDYDIIGDVDMRGRIPKLSLPTKIEAYDGDMEDTITPADIVAITAAPTMADTRMRMLTSLLT